MMQKRTMSNAIMSHRLTQICKTISKKQEDLAQGVLAKMSLEEQKFQAEEERLRRASQIQGWCAISLLFVPFLAVPCAAMAAPLATGTVMSAGIFSYVAAAESAFAVAASPMLALESNQFLKEAIVAKTEAEMVVAATRVVKNVLIPAIMDFAEVMSLIAGFFNVVTYEVQDFNDCASDAMEEKKKHHFLLLNRKAVTIQNKCSRFIAMAPDFESDLECIPQGHLMNYAQEWLESQKSTSGWPILQGILGRASNQRAQLK